MEVIDKQRKSCKLRFCHGLFLKFQVIGGSHGTT